MSVSYWHQARTQTSVSEAPAVSKTLKQALFTFRQGLGHATITERILTEGSVYKQLSSSNFKSDTKRPRAQAGQRRAHAGRRVAGASVGGWREPEGALSVPRAPSAGSRARLRPSTSAPARPLAATALRRRRATRDGTCTWRPTAYPCTLASQPPGIEILGLRHPLPNCQEPGSTAF